MRLRIFVAAAALLSASLAARADTYNYSFTASTAAGGGQTTAVSFDEPSILTAPTTIDSADFVSSSTTARGGVLAVFIDPLYTDDCTGDPDSCVEVTYTAGGGPPGAFFPNTNLTSVGVYTDDTEGTAALTITDLTLPSSVTPEPSSFVLLGTGLLGVLGMARRRRVG